jgi:hypothetical protein
MPTVSIEELINLTLRFINWIKGKIWRFIFCPFIKLALPVRDVRFGIAQSRMRYYLVEFNLGLLEPTYQEVDSNGIVKRYVFGHGERFVPPEIYEYKVIDKNFQFPTWGRIDWKDVFNGDNNSGCWGITERAG